MFGTNKKLKVLWFTNTPSLYERGKNRYHGGGWIESLQELIQERSEIELAVAFFHQLDCKKVKKDGVIYYPIKRISDRKSPFKAVLNNFKGVLNDESFVNKYIEIIDDFKPEVIHVFGSEGSFALVQEFTNIPVLIHLQGLIGPCLNAYFPVNFSRFDFLLSPIYFLKNIIGTSPAFGIKKFEKQAAREKEIFKNALYVSGRTEWDKKITQLYNPNVTYFHINEVLRPVFYEEGDKKYVNKQNKFIILSTLSPTIYKGIDIVIKTAKKLKELSDFDFEWRIIGLEANSDLVLFFEKKNKVIHQHLSIKFLGKMKPDLIVKQMQEAKIFVHPSYIDNSPNSICEAQIMGLPVIACNVGGVNSLIKHNVSGILIPSNGVFELVHYLLQVKNKTTLLESVSRSAKEIAIYRHDRDKIISDLLCIYSFIVNKHANSNYLFV